MDPIGPELEEIRSLAQRSQGLLGELREKAAVRTAQRQRTCEQLGEETTQLVEQVAASIASELASEIEEKHNEQQNEAEHQLQSQRAAWEQERSEWEDVRNQIEAELTQREQRLAERAAAVSSDSEERLAFANDEAVAERERLQQEFAEQNRASEERIAELEAELTALRSQPGGGQQDEAAQIELLEKFDIALADLQSHRERVSELEEQLATRPEPGAEAEAERAQLLNERDELAARVEQLEQQQAAGGGAANDSEELADLRSRFEMAVDDVRQLKNRNAELEERLAGGGGDGGGGDLNDWEAQKRRLLAQLEGEGDVGSGERAEERATIAGTIQITDGVVAEKEREIQQLREQLEQGGGSSAETVDHEAAEAMLADDEVIQAERERLAALESEWQEKLRQAELELSLERAKIARSQNELAERQLELETLRSALERAASDQPQGDSRQNWLKKLGLGGEET